ncbi:gp16 family protein [Vibrio tasmaniensis]|uniref:gp16 family protein n=1 Tax=Vibrio tasmaniensis TaxID=212663 RepID=UPI00107F6175|nr:regulatory protein GemA [Vibrio tasmaniensis]
MSNLLKLVQIAKRDLAMEDDSYRDVLEQCTGKRSAKGLNDIQLTKVLERMKSLGFKPKRKPQARAPEVAKIRAIWRTMHKQGFIRNANDVAIDAYVKRMTTASNGRGIEKAVWLKSTQAAEVLEALKKWHYRLMKEDILSQDGRIPMNDQNTGPAGYELLADYYIEKYYKPA